MLSLVAAVVASIWLIAFAPIDAQYLEYEQGLSLYSLKFVEQVVISFGTWFLALMNFVAISLMVTLEMIKFF